MIKLAYLNWWTRCQDNSNPQDNWIFNFIKANITNDIIEVDAIDNRGKKADNVDILLCSCFGDINKIIEYPCKKKIFFYGENLERYFTYSDFTKLKLIFDLIIGFCDTDLKRGLIHLPLWITYYNYYNIGFSDSKEEDKAENNLITYITFQYNKNRVNTNDKAVLIARHDRGGIRTKIFNYVLKSGVSVDCPGRLLNNCAKLGSGNNAKLEYMKQYKYNICPENSKADNYFTEKIFQAFEAGCIPIYWAIDYPEPKILNKSAYIFIDDINTDNNVLNNNVLDNNVLSNNVSKEIFLESAKDELKEIYTTLEQELKKLIFSNK
jgi:hypothetical protein